jgi:O-acetyl-ADP-ribose deacetylase (regulator of RNase III)
MGQDLRTNAELVRRTTSACLALADELGCASLALPAFGTGVGGLSIETCARVMVEEARAFDGASLDRVIFGVIGPAADAFRDTLAQPA